MITYRHLKEADLPAYEELCCYCFNMPPASGPVYTAWVRRFLDRSWGAFDGAKLAAGMWYHPFEMRVGQKYLPMGGIAAVATAPEYRNAGLARGMILRAHRQMRAEGRPLGVLMPFQYEFYRRMGYGDTFRHLEATFAPAQIAPRRVSGYKLRAVDGPREWKLLEKLRCQQMAQYFGPTRRNAAYWRARWFTSPNGVRRVYLVERSGVPKGYVITGSGPDPKGDERQLFVAEAVWHDQKTWDAILQFLRVHRDQFTKIIWFLPLDTPLHDQLIDPEIDLRLKPKMTLKLVDFKRALEMRTYPADLRGDAVVKLTGDDTSPWNTGNWRMRFTDGAVRVTKTKVAATSRDTLVIDSPNMAILYSGRLTISELIAGGRAKAGSGAITVLARAFPGSTPFIAEWF